MGFGQTQVLGERSWRMGGKSSGKNMPRNPLHNLQENLLNAWPVLTVFIGLILGTKKIKDRRTPTRWATGTKAQQSLWDTLGHPLPLPQITRDLRKHEMRGCKGIKISSPAIGARTSYPNQRSFGTWDLAAWAFCQVCFCCPIFQHAGLLVTSPKLDFLCIQLPPWELSPSWASTVLRLCLAGVKPRLFQPG